MSLKKKVLGGAAVVGMTVGLSFAGAGAAAAAVVPAPVVAGHTVDVRVDAPIPWQSCSGYLVPPYAALDLAVPIASGDFVAVADALRGRADVIPMRTRGLISLPGTIPGIPGTLFADNVPANHYMLAVICAGGDAPIEPHLYPVTVGNPFDAFAGSVSGSLGG